MNRTLIIACCLLPLAAAEETKEAKKKNPDKAPEFALKDVTGKEHRLSAYKGKVVVLEWINHGCPFVKKHYDCGNMQALQRKYTEMGIVWLTICSSAKGKQGWYSAKDWKGVVKTKKMACTAVLLDGDGKVGKLYGAKATPTMVVITKKGEIAYFGAIDDNQRAFRPEEIKAARNYVSEALEAVLAGKAPAVRRTKAYGCSVKYAAP